MEQWPPHDRILTAAAIAFAGLATLATVGNARAQDARSCGAELATAGDDAAATAVVAGLADDLPAAQCVGATLTVERVGRGFRIELRRDDRSVARDVATLDDAGAWLESWLAPPEAPDTRVAPEAETEAAVWKRVSQARARIRRAVEEGGVP